MGAAAIVTMGVQQFRGLAADSREVKPGYLFAALSGSKTDGARFIEDAVKRGAIAVLGAPAAADSAKALGVRFIAAANPRLRLAELASEFYAAQPGVIAAVTGTNGKTSVASFLRQIWAFQGRQAASLGTIGIDAPSGHVPLGHTTPDPVRLHAELARLKHEGVDHLALEASSHGLDQYRLDGVKISACGFTNITRDHLDYHASFENYLSAKLRLFRELVKEGGVAVVNADADHSGDFLAAAEKRRLRVLTVGERGESLTLVNRTPHMRGQDLTLRYSGREHRIALPLAGSFQASNTLVAAGLALGLGDAADKVFAALATLKGAPGRLELVARTAEGAPIYVDYAHKPDALETVLTALRSHAAERLVVVFGCGGDRDAGKRPMMGAIAHRLADKVIVTDDNPRSERPEIIRAAILAACPDASEIGDRRAAIESAIAGLASGDLLVIAGKGHETGQIVGNTVHPFDDAAVAREIVAALTAVKP